MLLNIIYFELQSFVKETSGINSGQCVNDVSAL